MIAAVTACKLTARHFLYELQVVGELSDEDESKLLRNFLFLHYAKTAAA
jgi:hypothetical protein